MGERWTTVHRMRDASLRSNIIKGTLRTSILDGASHSAMLGLTRNYVAPFALTIRATTAQIGLLVSVPNLTSFAISVGALPGGFLVPILARMGQYIEPIGAVSRTPKPA